MTAGRARGRRRRPGRHHRPAPASARRSTARTSPTSSTSPRCRSRSAAPIRRSGRMVNVVGTVNVFEAVKRRGAGHGAGRVHELDRHVRRRRRRPRHRAGSRPTPTPIPHNHYGVYKQANEGNARVYWLDDGVPSVGLRPMTVYGVGRDQGMTSGPTKAIVAAVLGMPLHGQLRRPDAVPVRRGRRAHAGRRQPQRAAREAHVYNMPGTMAEGADARRGDRVDAVPEARGLVDFDPVSLPFPVEIDHDGIEAIGPVPLTPFADGVRESVAIYRGLAAAGRLDGAAHGLEVARLDVAASPSGLRLLRARAGPGARVTGAALAGAACDSSGAALAAAASINPPSAAVVGSPGFSSCPLIASVGVEEMPRLPASPVVVATATTRAESSRQAGKRRDVDAGRLGDRRQPVGREPAVVLAVLVGVDPVRVVPVAALVGRARGADGRRSSTRRSACGRRGSRCRGGRSAARPARRSRPRGRARPSSE